MPSMASRDRLIQSGVRLLEAMETRRELRTKVEGPCGTRRRGNCLDADGFRPVVVRDTTKHVTAHEQQLRERDQALEATTFRTTKFQAIDRCRKIGDGDCAARITSGIDHAAFFNPVRSAG